MRQMKAYTRDQLNTIASNLRMMPEPKDDELTDYQLARRILARIKELENQRKGPLDGAWSSVKILLETIPNDVLDELKGI